MANRKRVPLFTTLPLAALVVVILSAAAPGVQAAEPIGQVKTLSGKAWAVRSGEEVYLAPGADVFAKDVVVTGPDGTLGITFIDNSLFSAGPDTELRLSTFRFDTTTHKGAFETEVSRGTLAAVSGKLAKQSPEAMTVRTPSAVLAVRGTKFLVQVEEGASR